ncbi:PEPxxWA-CTERM sorting domain-containing protein [Thermaurantiacus sp.]
MRKLPALLAVAALTAAAPAAAVHVTGIMAPGGNAGTVFATGPGRLQVDFTLNAFSPITVDLALEAGDEGGIHFNSLLEVFTGVTLGQTLGALDVTLLGGPTFAVIGDVSAFFSSPVVGGSAGASSLRILFRPAGEGVGLLLGNVFGGGTDFLIAPGTLDAGDRFQLVLGPSAVPEPSTWATLVLGFGVMGLAMRRKTHTLPA